MRRESKFGVKIGADQAAQIPYISGGLICGNSRLMSQSVARQADGVCRLDDLRMAFQN